MFEDLTWNHVCLEPDVAQLGAYQTGFLGEMEPS
jgi:hypothetical protein